MPVDNPTSKGGKGGGGNSLNAEEQTQLQSIMEKTKNMSPADIAKRRAEAQESLKKADIQIGKYQETIQRMKAQENWTPEQIRQWVFKNGTRPETGEKARKLMNDRQEEINKLERTKRVVMEWLRTTS